MTIGCLLLYHEFDQFELCKKYVNHKNNPSRPNSIKLNRLGMVIPRILKRFSLIMRLIWAVRPMKLSRSLVLTLKLISNRWMVAPKTLFAKILFYIYS